MLRVGGLGYELQCPLGTGERLVEHADGRRVYVLTVAQDDVQRLLGFASLEERELCRLLLKVSGIGPALVLALLSADTPRRLLEAIDREDVTWLKRVKGVGQKTAQRICLEVKDKAAKWLQSLGGVASEGTVAASDPVLDDAVLALAALGFTAAEAEKKIEVARKKSPDADTEALVKAALRS